MSDSKKILCCLWNYRLEILGLVLIVIATILTIATSNSLGIAAMFVVALVLCAHRCVCHNCCKTSYSDDKKEGNKK
tara:strand:+ start:375 stop:602 length:228 start_codon:yes stop_codon:yes gene_type:complete